MFYTFVINYGDTLRRTYHRYTFLHAVPQPPGPRIKEEDIINLQEMFPTLDSEVVRSVLEAKNGHVDSAVTSLLQMTEAHA